MNKERAVVITHGNLDNVHAKTCHGLLRYTSKFEIVGVIDEKFPGKDAGEVMDGRNREVPIYKSFTDFVNQSSKSADFLIIGVATHGGKLPDEFKVEIRQAIESGLSIVNGLHEYLVEDPLISELALTHGVELIDIRKPKPVQDLHFWHGSIYDVEAPIIGILGVDCALGKRTTSGMIFEMMNQKGVDTQMIYTGQTGWMQGYPYGFIFDSTLNDFISGEIEHAITSCWNDLKPELILLEGQSSLRNPSGPGGSEFLLSGNAKGVILQVAPDRLYFEGYEDLKLVLPSARDEIKLINQYGSEVIAVTVANHRLSESELRGVMNLLHEELSVPVVAPLLDGVGQLYESISEYMSRYTR